jgi:CrcB protein
VSVLLVLVGGTVGAPSRYLLDRFVRSRTTGRYPLGTLVVNVIGCFILGVVAGGAAHAGWSTSVQELIGTGFCGGLTTFSTFSVEAVELMQGRRSTAALSYLALSCGVGIAAAAAGWAMV